MVLSNSSLDTFNQLPNFILPISHSLQYLTNSSLPSYKIVSQYCMAKCKSLSLQQYLHIPSSNSVTLYAADLGIFSIYLQNPHPLNPTLNSIFLSHFDSHTTHKHFLKSSSYLVFPLGYTAVIAPLKNIHITRHLL